MPGWHDATADMQNAGDFQMLGIVQEQHPARTQLFMQWKQMPWPIMVDSLNELKVTVVPITLFLDEHGIIRNNRPPRRGMMDALKEFLATDYSAPGVAPIDATPRPLMKRLQERAAAGGPDDLRNYGRALVKWPQDDSINASVDTLQRAADAEPDDALGHFQLGVAYRRRFESDDRVAGDFQRAIDAWSDALALNPNQYIWRRRIQQWGPRLDKPYSFYDWVETARKDIIARGDTPTPLPVEPSGAEFARPSRSFDISTDDPAMTSNAAAIDLDTDPLILIESTVVPHTSEKGRSLRVHITLRPNDAHLGHWNNEAEPMQLHIDAAEGASFNATHFVVANAKTATSDEVRHVEFEVKLDDEATIEALTLTGRALFNVCRGDDGVCLYRRSEFSIDVPVR